MKKSLVLLLALLVCMSAFVACEPTQNPEASTSKPTEETESHEDDLITTSNETNAATETSDAETTDTTVETTDTELTSSESVETTEKAEDISSETEAQNTEQPTENESEPIGETNTPDSGDNAEPSELAVFEFGKNGEAKHTDGGAMDEKTCSYTNNKYTLTFVNYEKVYKNARDAKGNSALKLGTGSLAASFEFTVPANVTCVVIRVAKYKSEDKKDTKISVNDTIHTLTKYSDNGEYDEITIDTSANKTVKFNTLEKQFRCMIDSITFIG